MLFEGEAPTEEGAPRRESLRLDGYAKIQHLFRLARKFQHPIVVFVGGPSSLPDITRRKTQPEEAFRFASHVHSQWSLDVPIILVVLSRKISGNIFGAWLADRVLAFEDTSFSLAMVDHRETHLVQMDARALRGRGIIDGTLVASDCDGHGSPVAIPKPRQLRAALSALLEGLACLSSRELLFRRREKVEQVATFTSHHTEAISRERVVMPRPTFHPMGPEVSASPHHR
jgi:acetyl-CoA carboxylase alpha subunit